jgi:hypothetical protein
VGVRDDEIGRRLERRQRLEAVGRGDDLKACLLEADIEDPEALRVAVDQQETVFRDAGLHDAAGLAILSTGRPGGNGRSYGSVFADLATFMAIMNRKSHYVFPVGNCRVAA